MSIERLETSFRITPSQINAVDAVTSPGVNQSQLSPGTTLRDVIPLAPTASQHWKLLSISVAGYLASGVVFGGGTAFGKMGKILTGLDLNSTVLTPLGGSGAMLPLPKDPSLVTTLWDPAIDGLPPADPALGIGGPALNTLLPLAASISLPQPIEIIGAQQIGIGIWILPSLIGQSTGNGGWVSRLYYSSYSFTYDNGL